METRLIDCFSRNYQEARQKFIAAAQARSLACQEQVMAGRLGLLGETLATDSVWWGRPDAEKLLIVTSGVHGVEGFCGSGCQVALLGDDALLDRASELDVALAIVHAVNPHGFSYGRRVNEDNVDINRNFVAFDHELPENRAYHELAPLLLPSSWPPDAETSARLSRQIEDNGASALGQALFRGQYASPDGMFFGGASPSWSNQVVRQFLRSRAGQARQIGWIDLHTGLGPRGNCEKVFIGKPDEFSIAQSWWGNDVISPVRTDSVMFEIKGPMVHALRDECPRAQAATIALEFGTVPLLRMVDALRADHWCWMHREPEDSARRIAAREELKRSFFVEQEDWFGMVVGQFRTAVIQSLLGLGADRVRTLEHREP